MGIIRKLFIGAVVLGAGFFLLCLRQSFCGFSDRKKTQAQAHYLMGLFYENQERFDEAIQEYNQAASLDKDIPAILLHTAISNIRKGNLDKARETLEQLKALDPQDAQAGLILALLYASQNQSEKAALEYEEVLKGAAKSDPKNIDILKSLAAVYYQQKKIEDAIVTYRLILEIDSKDYEPIFLLGSLLEEKGLRQEAISKFKETLAINPDYPDALNSLGYVYAEEGKNLSEAEGLVKKALNQKPDNGAYIDSLGWIYFKMGRIDQAIEQLEKAGGLLPDRVIYDHLGDAYFKKGLLDKAKAAWEKSLELDARQEKVREKLNQL